MYQYYVLLLTFLSKYSNYFENQMINTYWHGLIVVVDSNKNATCMVWLSYHSQYLIIHWY